MKSTLKRSALAEIIALGQAAGVQRIPPHLLTRKYPCKHHGLAA